MCNEALAAETQWNGCIVIVAVHYNCWNDNIQLQKCTATFCVTNTADHYNSCNQAAAAETHCVITQRLSYLQVARLIYFKK